MRRFLAGAWLACMLWTSAAALAQPALPVERGGVAGAPGGFPVDPEEPDWMAAHFINVGQGSAALFEFSCGAILIDTGRQREAETDWGRRFTEYLDRFFERRSDLERTLDVVYITHPHPDHTSGIAAILDEQRYRFRHVITDAETTGFSIADQRRLIRIANLRRVPHARIRTSMIGRSLTGLTSRYIDPLRCRGGAPDISVVWGTNDEPNDWPDEERRDENNHSVAVRIGFGESSFLVTGDMEVPALRDMVRRYARNPRLLDVDVYVAGHHGSRNGTSEEIARR